MKPNIKMTFNAKNIRFMQLLLYTLDAVGSWQMILPMPKSERAY